MFTRVQISDGSFFVCMPLEGFLDIATRFVDRASHYFISSASTDHFPTVDLTLHMAIEEVR